MASKTRTRAKPLAAQAPTTGARQSPGLDRYDVAILAALQSDGRLSNAELAARIGLSAAPTWRRMKWLEAQGFITGYRAELEIGRASCRERV